MPIDSGIPLAVEPVKFNDPFAVLEKYRADAQERQLRQQQIRTGQATEEARRQDTAKQARDEAAQQQYFDILSKSKTPDEAESLIRAQAPSLLEGFQKRRVELDEKAATLSKTTAEAKKLQGDIQKQSMEYSEPFLQLVEKSGYNPGVFDFALNTIAAHHDVFPVEQLRQQAGGDPAKIKQIIDGFKTTQQQTADTGAARFAAEKPKLDADAAVAQQVAAGTMGGLTPDQQRQAAQANRTAGMEQQRIALERERLNQSAGDKTELTPEGIDAAASMYAKTGQLPPLGMGDKTTRKAIINRAAVMVPGLDVASAKADYDANKKSLDSLQKGRDAISAFEKTASKNIDLFLDTAGKVVDTGSPYLNLPVRAVTGKMLGSPDQAAYDAARQVAINEIAKVTQGGGLSGVLSDTARKEVSAFNPTTATLKQTVAVMRLLKQDMANRSGAMDEQIAGIKSRIGKAAGSTDGPVEEYELVNGKLVRKK